MAKKKSSFLLEGKLLSAFPCFGAINNYIIIGRHNVLEYESQQTRTKVFHELDDYVTLSKLFGLSCSVFSLYKQARLDNWKYFN